MTMEKSWVMMKDQTDKERRVGERFATSEVQHAMINSATSISRVYHSTQHSIGHIS